MYCSAFVCEAPILLELFHLRNASENMDRA